MILLLKIIVSLLLVIVNDLQMYHDGTNSYLLNQVGNLEFYINLSEVGAR